ncbi:WD repeat-containing protein 25 [Megalops cyprinoides]|uniref:WD repeat-containing protein 25 n=1 Tax=Megalops cyprinoides TaxID=118141 RepID=UPI0018640EFD|nr:WD repeat-containing protein 25 [Megalops cyprinoides]
MTSLVAYEDSDSEDESSKEDEPFRPNANPDSQVEHSQGWQGQFGLSSSFQNRPVLSPLEGRHEAVQCSNTATPGTLRRVVSHPLTEPVHPQSSRSASLSSSGCDVAVKRSQHNTEVVRPYIPKRQRLAQQEKAGSSMAPQGDALSDQATGSKLLMEVSESVRPYLGRRCSGAELPRRVRLHFQAHQGPVNTVQWCPVPHLSHLLLSASMDRTTKVWDGAGSGRCLRTCSSHSGAVRDACWTLCGRHLLTGSFDHMVHLTDVETSQQVFKVESQFKVTCLALQPSDPHVFLCGGFSPEVKAWDTRTSKVVRVYRAAVQQTLDILFLAGGKEFVTSSDSVSRDSAERTLIAWDFQTSAKVSNQIFHERYTCPSLTLHPHNDWFVAQTNGNYIALFSAQRPYRMNKGRRFEGHKVEGFAVGCEFSPDGTVLASGSATGSVHFYDYQSSRALRTLQAHQEACVGISLHPVLPAVAATCDWSGEVNVWH